MVSLVGGLSLFASTGCQQDARIADLQKKVAGLEAALNDTKSTIDVHNTRLDIVEKEQGENDRPRSATFSPAERGFSTIYTDSAMFLVALVDIKPYANGYRAVFHLGNPSAMDLEGVALELRWGPSQSQQGETFVEWQKRFRTSTQEITKRIRGGSWNPIEVNLVPAAPEDIGRISIRSITTKTVLLANR